MSTLSSETFLKFAIEFSRFYLSAGGPTSRLEDRLTTAGAQYHLDTEVFATPTGIFISCAPHESHSTQTAIGRIKETHMNLSRLCWLEAILQDVHTKKLEPRSALKILSTHKFQRPIYTKLQMFLAAFAVGCAVSFPRYGYFNAAITSGLITMITYWLIGPSLEKILPSSIFKDFLGCLFTLMASAVATIVTRAPLEAYSIGGLILLVPGLALTTAISELADQNYISGTAKLMKALLTLLAMGIAYLLFQDLSTSWRLNPVSPERYPFVFWTSGIATLLSVFGFSVIFQVPRKALFWSTLTGLASWAVLQQFTSPKYFILASFLASLTVGIISLTFGTKFKIPSQVYSVPGILALLPGMMALSSFRSFAAGQGDSGLEAAFQVALIAGGIVFGLFCARIPFALIQNLGTIKRRRL